MNYSGNLSYLLEFTLNMGKLLSFLCHTIKIVFLFIQPKHFLSTAGDGISRSDKGYQTLTSAQSHPVLLTPFTGTWLNKRRAGPLSSEGDWSGDTSVSMRRTRVSLKDDKLNCIGWEQCSQQGGHNITLVGDQSISPSVCKSWLISTN